MKCTSLPLLRRREFMAVLGGAAASWPLAAHAQQPGKLPTIGYLGSGGPITQRAWVEAFVQRLRELGWSEGRTVAIEYRWGEGRAERYAEIAAEFVRLKVDVIQDTLMAAGALGEWDFDDRKAISKAIERLLALVRSKGSA